MRRNSSGEDARLYTDPLTSPTVITNGKNVGDLIYRFEKQVEREPDAMREIFASATSPPVHPQIGGGGSMLYYNGKNVINPVFVPDMKLSDLQYLRYLQQQQMQHQTIDKLRLRKPAANILSDSMLSLTDSEFYSDDQQQDFVSGAKLAGRQDDDMYDGMFRDQKHHRVVHELSRFSRFIEIMSRLPLPRMTFTGMGFCFLVAVFICPRACDENLLFPAFRLLFGTLYPAYASYKAVRTKNVKEYVKWMMYWIVYAFFTCIETFTDIFLSWFPFYYEIKVLIVLWLLSPATKGSSTLYRKFVHPMLTRREPEIDEYLNQAKEKGYTAVLQLGSKGVNYATNVIMQTALKGGGNLVQTIRRSYSLSDLSEPDDQRTQDEIDEVGRPQRLLRPRSQTARSSSGGRNVDMYFSEVDVASKAPQPNFNYVRSSDDISSGYSSAEPISSGLSRTASLTNATKPRFKAKRVEDDVYLESDEYETLPEVRHDPLNYSSYVSNPCTPNYPMPSRLTRTQRPQSDIIADWKMQAFFDNQKYFQDVVLENLRNNQPPDNDGGVVDGDDVAQKSTENLRLDSGNNDTMKGKPTLPEEINDTAKIGEQKKMDTVKDKLPAGLRNDPLMAGMSSKYELFCKWLEENEKTTAGKAGNSNHHAFTKRAKQKSEDEFKDTVSASSDDELFHDTDNSIGIANVEESSYTSPQLLESKKESELSQSVSLEVVAGETALPSILEDYNASRKSSTSDGKRSASHHKGKAPNPPSITTNIDANTTEKLEVEELSQKDSLNVLSATDLPETVSDLNELSTDDIQHRSRSPSPRPDSKSKSAKATSLFKSYLPSIFRSQSPKPTASEPNEKEDDNHKETQI